MREGTPQRKRVAPRASVLIESMRDIGYSLPTAIADLIDNSLTAGARRIEILADTDSEVPTIGVLDDGCGMSEPELLEAMRPGTRNPLENRDLADLGRFGLGLKTASFSQCRRVTVVTRKNGQTSGAVWDADTVAETDDWFVEIPGDLTGVPWFDQLDKDGTLVVWQKLDRLVTSRTRDRTALIRQIDEAASHVELVFHRFLSRDRGHQSVKMFLNGRSLEPLDPFHSTHPATQNGPEENIALDGVKIRIQPVTLPHHSKVTQEEWVRYALTEGYVRSQGFYLYRNRRLIVHGTWFGLMRQSELTKLARVRIDIPNSLDTKWKIDVRKASAQPPEPVRQRLRRIVEQIGAPSKRTYTSRGARLTTNDKLPVWTRHQQSNQIHYRLNPDHPVFTGFMKKLSKPLASAFRVLLDLVESALPVDTIHADTVANPETVAPWPLPEDRVAEDVTSTYRVLREGGSSRKQAEVMMSSAEPFRINWEVAKKVIEEYERRERAGE